ncbi:AraC family transcriptional regulator [Oceanobacillus sp. FSL W8-0428]|uniref:AraC family transcriptional regulator n=1 Tax=Oceanobacillus TaxID=182709 RepID=UPI0030DD9F18
MSKFKWLKSRLLYKYIVSYLLIFLVPFSVLSFIVYKNSVSSLREEIEQANISKLEQVKQLTDERMNELETLAARISYDPRLTPYMVSDDYYGGEAIDELKKYKANSSIIEELFVYYHSKDILYSTNGSYPLNVLLERKYQFEDWEKEQFIEELHTNLPMIKSAENIITNEGNKERVVAYLFPIAPNNPTPYGTVMFFIKESMMNDQMETILGDFEGNAYILNENNEEVAAAIHDEDIAQSDLDKIIGNKQGIDNLKINGNEYSRSTVKSDDSGWTFVTILDTEQFFERLQHTKQLILLIITGIFVLGIVLAVYLGRNQYKPIKKLFELTNGGLNNENKNELETIQHRISHIYHDYQMINETVDLQQPFAREQLLVRLLRGDINDEKEIEKMLDTLHIPIKAEAYFVAIIFFEEKNVKANEVEIREKVLKDFSELALTNAVGQAVNLLYNDTFALIIGLEKRHGNAGQERGQVIREVQYYMRERLSSEPTISVGGICNEKKSINRSYIEALAAMDYKFMYPAGSIINFEDISLEQEQVFGYPREEQIKLVQSLKQGDVAVAKETLTDIFSLHTKKGLPLHAVKLIYYDIINTVIKTISDLGLRNHIQNIDKLAEFSSSEQLHRDLLTMIQEVCKEVAKDKESHNDQLRKDILNYIQLNFDQYDLSLGKIAVEFQLSASYVSRFIKDQTGVNFSEYVQELRMNYVKQQLVKSNDSIKQIVLNVGYKDVANFTRKFKKNVGITPGQYRRFNR